MAKSKKVKLTILRPRGMANGGQVPFTGDLRQTPGGDWRRPPVTGYGGAFPNRRIRDRAIGRRIVPPANVTDFGTSSSPNSFSSAGMARGGKVTTLKKVKPKTITRTLRGRKIG